MFQSYGSYGTFTADYGAADPAEEAAKTGLTGDQIEGIASGGTAVFDWLASTIQSQRESLQGLIKRRAKLQKKRARTHDRYKREQYTQQIEALTLQIDTTRAVMAQQAEGDSGPPWALIGAGTLLVGGVLFAIGRAMR